MWPICCCAGDSRCWQWLQNDCSLSVVVDKIVRAIKASKWQSWLVVNKVGLLNQLVARCVLGLPVRRSEEVVPDSSGGLVGVTWQDLENDGLAYISQPGTSYLLLVSSSLMGTQMTAVCVQCQSVRLPSVLGATSGIPA